MRPVVIIDTNALYALGKLQHSDVRILQELSLSKLIRLIIPDVVIQELGRHYANEVSKQHELAHAAIVKFGRHREFALGLGVVIPNLGQHGSGPITVDRRDFTRSLRRWCALARIEVPKPPDIPTDELLDRDLDAKKPFAYSGGTGFRDALIWATIQQVCSSLDGSCPRMVFVTDNYKDFGENATTLHADLRAEIPVELEFDLVKDLSSLLKHPELESLVEQCSEPVTTITVAQIESLVSEQFDAITGLAADEILGEQLGGGVIALPYSSDLSNPVILHVDPDFARMEVTFFDARTDGSILVRGAVPADVGLRDDSMVTAGLQKLRSRLVGSGRIDTRQNVRQDPIPEEEHRLLFTFRSVVSSNSLESHQLVIEEVRELVSATVRERNYP